MTTPIGIWQITGDGPARLPQRAVDLERQLEDWIERDPTLLQQGLTIVARQMVIEGGRLDLLALDPQGRWVVIEIKAGAVRRETVAQAIDYASCIAELPEQALAAKVNEYFQRTRTRTSDHANGSTQTYAELMEDLSGSSSSAGGDDVAQREVTIQVVGTGRDRGLERMVNYLSGTGTIEIAVVSFEVFETASGDQILTRELTEADAEIVARRESPTQHKITIDAVLAAADGSGIGPQFRRIYEVATEAGLHPRPYKNSIMYAPPSNKTRCIIYARAVPYSDGRMRIYVSGDAIEEFFGIPADRVREAIGIAPATTKRAQEKNEDLRVELGEVERVARAVREVFANAGDEGG